MNTAVGLRLTAGSIAEDRKPARARWKRTHGAAACLI